MDIAFLPPSASEFAKESDMLFWYINAVCALGGIVVYIMVFASCYVFARRTPTDRTPRILGSTKLELAWSAIPLLFFLTFFVWGTKLYNNQTQVPEDAPEYFVVGKQWMWKMQHPDGQREINELHLPVNTTIKITGTSEDVIHDFGIPAFRSKFDVVPGRYTSTWYKPIEIGTYHIFCDQYCGQGHSQMVGKVHVLSQADYLAWKEGTYRIRDGKSTADGSPAWEGRKLFLKLQCNACHNAESQARAPRLEAMYGKDRPLQGGKPELFKDDYIRRSIRDPMAQVADGWKPIMPAFPVSQVDEIELRNLVAYIKSLKLGDLPTRTEQFPAPQGAPTTDSLSTPLPVPAPVPGPVPVPPIPPVPKSGGSN